MIVMKFGGSSVANREQVDKVLQIVKGRGAQRPLVVSSAHKGMTDALVSAATSAACRDFVMPDVIDLQSEIADAMGCGHELLAGFYSEISDMLRGVGLLRELSPRSLDFISSFGERMAVRVIADYFSRHGLKAQAFDVWDLGFITDSNFGCARPIAGADQMIKKACAELIPPDVVPIVTGFVGRTESGEITTVGRNGSDYTAAVLAAAIGAEELQVWTDTNGVMTADPSVVTGAQNLPEMTFGEAAELAYFGSRVLHPSTLLPAMEKAIPVRVMNTNRPDHPGTVIGKPQADAEAERVRSIAYKENQAVVTIRSTSMLQTSGFLADIFTALAELGVVVDMIATSEITVSFTTQNLSALEDIQKALCQFGECEVATGKTMLAIVGRNLARRRGQGAEILAAMRQEEVKVDMISFGMGSINFAMVVDDSDIQKAVPVLHKWLFEQ